VRVAGGQVARRDEVAGRAGDLAADTGLRDAVLEAEVLAPAQRARERVAALLKGHAQPLEPADQLGDLGFEIARFVGGDHHEHVRVAALPAAAMPFSGRRRGIAEVGRASREPLAEALVAELLGFGATGQRRDGTVGEGEVDPRRRQPRLADPGPQPLRAMRAHEGQHVVERRHLGRERA
jgi:hypothetical protein